MTSTDDANNIKIRIIRSLFSNRTENGDLIENYITHIKVLEESHYLFLDGQDSKHTTRKRRYILISVKNNGKVQVHKSRENNNGTFSIGKTWDMTELQRIDNVDAYKVIVTFQKPYHWICESTKDKMFFIEVLVKIYKKFTGGKIPIMNGFEETKNSDITSYIESDLSFSQRLSHASYEQKNVNDSLTKHSSFSSQQRLKSTRNSQSSEKYSSNRSSLSYHSSKFTKGHKETLSFSSNQYLFSDSLSQIMEKQNSGSFSLNSNLSEKFENNDTSKHNSDFSSTKSPDYSIFGNKDKKNSNDSNTSLNKEFLKKTKFFDNLTKPFKKNDYEIIKSPSNDKDADDIINHIDQILDSFDWTALENVAKLEEKLKDELSDLESENIQRIIESNNKMKELSENLQPSIKECKKLNSILSLYSAELNSLKDDIFHIEIQNRGLQVQAANQKKLALELQNLLDTLSINVNDLEPLKKASFESTAGIMDIEKSLTFLYKALKIPASETDNEKPADDIAIMKNKRAEYEKESNDFLSRLAQYLSNKFQTELSNLIYKDYSPTLKVLRPHLVSHTSTYMSFYRYQSFMLYAKQINHSMFSIFQECYIKYTREFYNNNFEKFFNIWKTIIKKISLEENEFLFTSIKETSSQGMINIKAGNIKRSVTTFKTYRAPIIDSWKEENQEAKVTASEAFFCLIKEIVTAITQEQNFITSFFHLISIKKQDYTELVSWNNNQDDIADLLRKKRPVESNKSMAKLVLNMMSKIMNFLHDNLLTFGEFCCKSDPMCILENIRSLEKFLLEWEKTDQEYLIRILNKLYFKHIEFFHMFIDTQVQAIESVRMIGKRKQGVLSFFRIFPDFVEKYIKQNPGSDNIEINELLDKALEKLNHAMFKTFNMLSEDTYNLSNILKVDSEDKELLYYHIMVVENMFYYLQELRKKDIFILDLYIENANIKYQEHLNLYIENVIKRPLGRIMEFSESIDALLKTKTIEEIKNRMSFSVASLKRIMISYDIKEVLKGIETLYKRVEKHFRNEENPYFEQLIAVVWNRINDEYREKVKRFHQLVENYYKTDGIYINWTYDDLESSFLRKGIM
ncbi:hypothetical protein PNEG_01705 [Pneumocystis murina B123]|uniref:Exocyst complex component Sec3 PIP2-binding N-terminal domain-containing protein n=1 Tax=Pneumocystis murina (strain B123) TaxID=1069680 RepID=M7NRP1_PNEMU|nr:hypothetical protein PNEG_01705 [Pneumocystis murina B123]EMR09947.1 hypothetical protein PNEG_01705 [Pneumocystis murina B123]